MNAKFPKFALSTLFIACLTACGGGGGASSSNSTTPVAPTAQSVNVPLMISDATNDDWSVINVTVTSVTFTDSAGNVTANLLSTPWTGNLLQLDSLTDQLNAATLTAGTTYSGATITISANPGDVSLTVASDPEAGFPETASTATTPNVIPASRIEIQGATGAAGAMTVTVPIKFTTPFVAPAPASAGSTTPTTTTGVNIEFDLSHPAFLIGHVPAGGGNTIWAVNFNGPVKHKPYSDLTRILSRHLYGKAISVSSDNTSLTFTKEKPTLPIVSPETATDTSTTLTATIDATNGTLFYDLDDATKNATIKDLSTVGGLLPVGTYMRVATRYQQNGTYIATRIFASSSFNKVFISPEGHVTHIDSKNGTSFWVDDESGKSVKVAVNANTKFYFRNPGTASDVTPIGVGPGFLTSSNLARGFKVKVSFVDPLATSLVASVVDIEAAHYEGKIWNVTSNGFTLNNTYPTASDNYSVNMAYLSANTANGTDPQSGLAITGFKYWNYGYPTQVTSGAGAITSFTAVTGGASGTAISFGNANGSYYAHGLTYAVWGDPASTNGWSAPFVVLTPITLPSTTITTPMVAGSAANTQVFTISQANGTPVTVDVSTATGSATLAYQVDRSADQVTVTPQDLTNATVLGKVVAAMVAGSKVEVTGTPQADGSIRAYSVKYYTGTNKPSI